MAADTTTQAIELFVGLVAAAGLVGWLIHRLALPIPYTVALVVLGIVAGVVLPVDVEVSPEIVLLVLLPGLVFEAALRIDIDDFRRTFGGVVLLAAPGVLVSAAIVAAVLAVATGLPLELGFVVGAIVIIAVFFALAMFTARYFRTEQARLPALFPSVAAEPPGE